MKFIFKPSYFIWFCLLLGTEIIIGFYVKDEWIRPFFGDFLVVILLYCFTKSFVDLKVNTTLLCVLLFSYLVETLQYFHFVELVGLQNIALARILIGTFFSWVDMAMYTLGVAFVWFIELLIKKYPQKNINR